MSCSELSQFLIRLIHLNPVDRKTGFVLFNGIQQKLITLADSPIRLIDGYLQDVHHTDIFNIIGITIGSDITEIAAGYCFLAIASHRHASTLTIAQQTIVVLQLIKLTFDVLILTWKIYHTRSRIGNPFVNFSFTVGIRRMAGRITVHVLHNIQLMRGKYRIQIHDVTCSNEMRNDIRINQYDFSSRHSKSPFPNLCPCHKASRNTWLGISIPCRRVDEL